MVLVVAMLTGVGIADGLADSLTVDADGNITATGRFAGAGASIDRDFGPLSRLVVHIGTGIAIRQGLLSWTEDVDELVERMMSDAPGADDAADELSRRIEAAVHESTAAYLARRLFCALSGFSFPWWSCLPQESDPRYMKGSDGIIMPTSAFVCFARLVVQGGNWLGRGWIVPETWFAHHPISEFRRGDDFLRIDTMGRMAEFSVAERALRSDERMNAKDSPGAVKYQCLLMEPSGKVKRTALGDFIRLAEPEGRLLLVYDRMTEYGDEAASVMCRRYSADGGQTWSESFEMFTAPEGSINVMQPSLINLRNGDVGLVYLHKRSLSDCRPLFRRSSDGGVTWTEPIEMIATACYHAPANGMLSRDSTGRIHYPVDATDELYVCDCYSDDDGATWSMSERIPFQMKPNKDWLRLEEPNVFERKDGTLVMSMRTNADYVYFSESTDGGETWGPIYPSTLRSPRHPAKIIRIPDGRLACAWIDHEGRPEQMFKMPYHRGTRAPFTVGLSSDEGRTWTNRLVLEPTGWNSNPGMRFYDGCLMVNYGMDDFNSMRIVKVPIEDMDALPPWGKMSAEAEIVGDIELGPDFASASVTVSAHVTDYGYADVDATVVVTLEPEGGGTPLVREFAIAGDTDPHRFVATFDGLTAGRRYRANAKVMIGGSVVSPVKDAFAASRELTWFEESAATFPNAGWNCGGAAVGVADGLIARSDHAGGSVVFTPAEHASQGLSRIVVRARFFDANEFENLAPPEGLAAVTSALDAHDVLKIALWGDGAWHLTDHVLTNGAERTVQLFVNVPGETVEYRVLGEDGVWSEGETFGLRSATPACAVAFEGRFALRRLTGFLYDCNLVADESGNEYADYAVARSAGAEDPLIPLWRSTWPSPGGFGSFLVRDPNEWIGFSGETRVLRRDVAGESGLQQCWYGPASEAEVAAGAGKYVHRTVELGLEKALTEKSTVRLTDLLADGGTLSFGVEVDGQTVLQEAIAEMVEWSDDLTAKAWRKPTGMRFESGRVVVPPVVDAKGGFVRVKIRE